MRVNNSEMDFKVCQSNKITQATYKLKLQPQRLLLLAINKSNKKGVSQVLFDDFAEAYGLPRKKARDYIHDNANELITGSVSIKDDSTGFFVCNWIQSILHNKGDEYVTVVFSDPIKPLITNQKNMFTTCDIRDIGKLTNPHSYRLHLSFCQWRNVGTFTSRVDWMYENYKLPKSYKEYREFKRRFLTPCLSEINEKTLFNVEYTEIKERKKVIAIEFKLKRKRKSKKIC